MHLPNAFRKLGVSSRTQLPAALAAPRATVIRDSEAPDRVPPLCDSFGRTYDWRPGELGDVD